MAGGKLGRITSDSDRPGGAPKTHRQATHAVWLPLSRHSRLNASAPACHLCSALIRRPQRGRSCSTCPTSAFAVPSGLGGIAHPSIAATDRGALVERIDDAGVPHRADDTYPCRRSVGTALETNALHDPRGGRSGRLPRKAPATSVARRRTFMLSAPRIAAMYVCS